MHARVSYVTAEPLGDELVADVPITPTGTGLSAATDTITQTATALANGDQIWFTSVGASTTLVAGQVYFVVSKATNTFKVSLTSGGSAVTIGTATVAYIRPPILYVADVADFDEQGGSVQVNDNVYVYTAIDDDASTVTLADPGLSAAATAGDKVDIYDTTDGKVAIEYVAGAVLDGMDPADPIEVSLRHNLAPLLQSAIRGEASESVEVERVDGQLQVVNVLGKEAAIDATFSYAPIFRSVKGSDSAVPTGTWTRVAGWFTFQSVDVGLQLDGRLIVEKDGVYDCRCGASFSASGTGARGVRLVRHDIFGGTLELRKVQVPNATGAHQTTIETNQLVPLSVGEAVSLEVWHSAGADLNVLGSNPFIGDPILTDFNVAYARPR